MFDRPAVRGHVLRVIVLVGSVLALHTTPAGASTGTRQISSLNQDFRSAAREFGVPGSVLLAVSYHLTLWEDHHGLPSTSGGYGPMHLTHVPGTSDPSLHTLDAAARLLHLPLTALERDPLQNIRAGAALLARYAGHPRMLGDWYGAVIRYQGSRDPAAYTFADAVFQTIRSGTVRRISDGEVIRLTPQHVLPNRAASHLHPLQSSQAECPPELACRFIPAAYHVNSASNPQDYGNYDVAHRDNAGPAIRYIVIHDTEGSYNAAIATFQNPTRYASANYVIRSSDGAITQMVKNQNIAWHCGDYYVNMHSIGIEHEGVAIQGASWYSEQLYETSAALVRYLADRYHVPLDRAHIVGHDNVPGPTPQAQSAQHWDPGPFWDWQHYMQLLGAPAGAPGNPGSPIITIDPNFATNQPAIASTQSQPANFLYLRTVPNASAPLIGDAAIGGGSAGTTAADDWGDKAVSGQQFVRVDRQGDWDAIDYGGQEAWLYDPPSAPTVEPATGTVITPRPGQSAIPVYGAAYPESSAYPKYVHPHPKIVPLQYSILTGQMYVVSDLVTADYYWSPTQTRHAFVQGKTRYYQISFNHRFAFVKASDVVVINVGQ